jgi:hypothetical protein
MQIDGTLPVLIIQEAVDATFAVGKSSASSSDMSIGSPWMTNSEAAAVALEAGGAIFA